MSVDVKISKIENRVETIENELGNVTKKMPETIKTIVNVALICH